MKRRLMSKILLLLLLMPMALKAQSPMSFKQFFKKDTVKVTESYYNAYESMGRYYIEIPRNSMNMPVLISGQVVNGQSAYVSPSSGVVKFTMGRDNTVDMYRNVLTEGVTDSTDICMMNSIRKSGLLPVAQSFPIVAYGKDGKSPIIEITQDLNSSVGLFACNDNMDTNSPDPSRSGILGIRAIDKGLVFNVLRTQNNYVNDPNAKHGEDDVNSYVFDFLIQKMPESKISRKETNKAYGFLTGSIYEYDTKHYIADKHQYIVRWRKDSTPITVYIDPVTPAPFKESIRKAFEAWQAPLAKAGWKKPFSFTSDKKDAALSYKKILVRWGVAYNGLYSNLITDSISGEIIAARINVMDVHTNDLLNRYFLQCGDKDPRILKDKLNLEVRKEILRVEMEQELAEVLGIKHNYAASTAFTTSNLQSNTFVSKYGMSPSITSQLTFNYVANSESHISTKDLLPKISTYDYEAIAYLYGNRTASPSIKAAYYADLDKQDPYAQDYICHDVVKASELGIKQLGKVYPRIHEMVKNLPSDQNTWHTVNRLGMASLDLYTAYTFQASGLIGGKSKRAVIPGENEKATVYVSKEDQQEALAFLNKYLYKGYPKWFDDKTMAEAIKTDLTDAFSNTARFTFERFLKAETINSLLEAERTNGNQAFTCQDLLSFLSHNILKDFNPEMPLTGYERSVASMLIGSVLGAANSTNFLTGMNDAASIIHSYLMDITEGTKKMAKECKDESTRKFYNMTLIKLNHEYFNK